MRCCKLIQYDIKNGLIRNLGFLLIPFCVLIVCNQCRMQLASWEQPGTWAVYLAYCFKGMHSISRQTLSGGIQIPVFWMLMLILPLFITLNFPFKDMKTIGTQMLLRSERRVTWWLCKCFWNLCCTAIYFLLIFASITVFCLCFGVRLSLEMPMGSMMAIFSEADITTAAESMSTLQTIFVLMVLPILTIAAMNMVEMMLGIVVGPLYGFLFSVALVAAASYVTSPILIGNYANLARCGSFINDGLNGQTGFLMCLSVILLATILGAVAFRQRDILPDYKEF